MSKVNLYQAIRSTTIHISLRRIMASQLNTMALVIGEERAALIDTGAGIADL